ncbi:hypothetical protein LGN19_28200 [Burkholderia sp. AU30198]|uniref:hypothetical protein n=1 Tax=Burkholderia sp. AU30198 TaxID=2879627 RepID=UPI001CF10099|nr:hypothetical protein [Burkholderia sp. AU30198]MCA8297678.1 hypothetical protein [Burkholderia sp. AU30198]
MHTVKITRNRPDFRCFIDLLYGYPRNVDTDGDAYPVNSRLWTRLYLRDRKSDAPRVSIDPTDTDPAIFTVTSDAPELEELTALYLYLTSGDSISASENLLAASDIERLTEKHAEALQRADRSVWHQSSDEDPYPNQRLADD